MNTVNPAIDIAYFRRGIFKGNVMGFHVNTRFIAGYGGKVAPPTAGSTWVVKMTFAASTF